MGHKGIACCYIRPICQVSGLLRTRIYLEIGEPYIQVAKVLQRYRGQSSGSPSDPSLLQVWLEFAGISAPKGGDCSPLVSSVLQYLIGEEGSRVGEGNGVWVCGLQLSGRVSNPAMETRLCVTRGKDCIACPTSGMNKGPLWLCQILPTAKLLLCTEGSGAALWQITAATGAAGGRGSLLGPVIPRGKMYLPA